VAFGCISVIVVIRCGCENVLLVVMRAVLPHCCTGKPVREWGAGLLSVLPNALTYIIAQGRDVEGNRQAWCVAIWSYSSASKNSIYRS